MSLSFSHSEVLRITKKQKTDKQLIFDLMRDGEWRTQPDIAVLTGVSIMSTGQRLRELKAEGQTKSIRKTAIQGLYEYQILPKLTLF